MLSGSQQNISILDVFLSEQYNIVYVEKKDIFKYQNFTIKTLY